MQKVYFSLPVADDESLSKNFLNFNIEVITPENTSHSPISELVRLAGYADGVIIGHERISQDVMDLLPYLKVIVAFQDHNINIPGIKPYQVSVHLVEYCLTDYLQESNRENKLKIQSLLVDRMSQELLTWFQS